MGLVRGIGIVRRWIVGSEVGARRRVERVESRW